MQYKIISISVSPSTQELEELNVFLRTHKIVNVIKELVNTNATVQWCFCIQYLWENEKMKDFSRSKKVNYQEILSKEEFIVFEKMRAVRNDLAKKIGVPAYAVFTNEELSILCKAEKIDKTTLLKLNGFGEGRLEKTGNLFIHKWNEENKE